LLEGYQRQLPGQAEFEFCSENRTTGTHWICGYHTVLIPQPRAIRLTMTSFGLSESFRCDRVSGAEQQVRGTQTTVRPPELGEHACGLRPAPPSLLYSPSFAIVIARVARRGERLIVPNALAFRPAREDNSGAILSADCAVGSPGSSNEREKLRSASCLSWAGTLENR